METALQTAASKYIGRWKHRLTLHFRVWPKFRETHEAIAKAKNPRSPLVREARSLLTLPKDYYQDDRHFSKDPRFLIRRRERIAGLIEKLSR